MPGRSRRTPHCSANGMSTELPLYRQEKPRTCALACLRMILAAYGTTVTERELEAQARLEPQGTQIDELARLAREFGLAASVEEATVADLQAILAAGQFPITYVNRTVFELRSLLQERSALRHYRFHSVIPTRVTESYVTFHDPLPP